MNNEDILDLGGNTSASTVSSSHLGSGTPQLSLDGHHPKRARHDGDDTKLQISELKKQLNRDVISLLTSGKVNRAYALVYKDVERLCIAKHSEQASLARYIFDEIESAFTEIFSPKITETLSDFSEDSCLECAARFLKICDEWNELLKLLSQLFLYLDRSYLLHHPKHAQIRNFGIDIFVKGFVQADDDFSGNRHDPLSGLVTALWKTRQNHRSNGQLRDALCRLITVLSKMDPQNHTNVNKSLESIILKSYSVQVKQWQRNKETYVSVFLQSVSDDSMLLKESGKSSLFVKQIISSLMWSHLMSDLNLYLEPSLPHIVRPENFNYLKAVRHFCDTSMDDFSIDATKILVAIWGKYVQSRTKSLILDSDLIHNLLALWDELHLICDEGFNADRTEKAFESEVRKSLGKTLGSKDFSAPVIVQLSKFCDAALKQASKSREVYADAEKKVLTIFKLIPDKAAFISIYEKDLSKRLLMAKNVDFAFETQLVKALVSVVGEKDENFKLRAMLRDYTSSRTSFSNIALQNSPNMEFSALVLEKKVWPEIPGFGEGVRLPHALSSVLAEFGKLLPEKDQQYKKLDWDSYTLHQITLSTSFLTGTKDLQVNLSQAIVLLLFEDADVMSFSQILEATGMSEKLLKRVLASLSTDKYPVLHISNHIITFNHSFSDRAHKIKLPMSREREVSAVEEAKHIIERDHISESRAMLVKIMKDHKVLSYTELLGKTIEALTTRGVPSLKVIKTEIESLIEKEYFSRDPEGVTLTYIP